MVRIMCQRVQPRVWTPAHVRPAAVQGVAVSVNVTLPAPAFEADTVYVPGVPSVIVTSAKPLELVV